MQMVGIDIVDVSRIVSAMEKYGDSFLRKLFTVEEMGCIRTGKRVQETVAGRFAAKEAFMKAFGRRLPWREIEVLQTEGRPFIRFRGETFCGVSISHERAYAVATVVL